MKSRKGREAWVRGAPNKNATKKKKVATIPKKDATKSVEEIPSLKELKEDISITEKTLLDLLLQSFNATLKRC